jgi:hypothetical protein
MDLEEVWRIREEEIYPALYGKAGRGIFPLSPELFSQRFGKPDPNPRWLRHGVIEFMPKPDRPSWLYVTSGYSNPWDQDPETYDVFGDSGSGIELIFAASEQAPWAIELLQSLLAFDILHGAGHYPGQEAPKMGSLIPLRQSINGDPACTLRGVFMTPVEDFPNEFTLPSGRVLMVGYTGVTEAELDYGRRQGPRALIDRLRAAGAHPVTDPRRASAV